jgi:hypothetical protein
MGPLTIDVTRRATMSGVERLDTREWRYGQRHHASHQWVVHMAAPTSDTKRVFKLANGEPSTRGSWWLLQ